MSFLSGDLRKKLSDAVAGARAISESACRSALTNLGVFADRRPDHLNGGQTALRVGLRAKWRQLGTDEALLIAECAYEHFHRLLFARFLAENNLLLHPEFKAPMSLAECEGLAGELGEPDGWSVAAQFASEILPGIFRLDDPCVRLRLSPEGRMALEEVVEGLPVEVFTADDGLGWVYQFWQKEKKDEVNRSERKIGGADLGPATQLFTENYMVRFLLQNSLGAWWAARHPDSPLLKDWEFLRFDDERKPASGSFEEWPKTIAEVTVMDPCCGSGHFLVEAFGMLWRMRAEDEGLDPIAAQDEVLRDNLFGLELDPRCVEIAMFATVLAAWKAGGGWRELPVPHIACSGIPVKAPVEEWKALAGGEERLENALDRLHILFRDADTLGSLIDPKLAVELSDPKGLQASFEDVDWDDVAPLLTKAVDQEADDPATAVLGADVAGIARAADYLSRNYTLVATNVPFLSIGKQSSELRRFLEARFERSAQDLATAVIERGWAFSKTEAVVSPQSWQQQQVYEDFRAALLIEKRVDFIARIGNDVWQRPGGGGGAPFKLHTALSVLSSSRARPNHQFPTLDVASTPRDKRAEALALNSIILIEQDYQVKNAEKRIVFRQGSRGTDLPLGHFAHSYQGMATGDFPRFGRRWWEVSDRRWHRLQSTVVEPVKFGGREYVVDWNDGRGALASYPGARVQGISAWQQEGVAISQMGDLKPTLYLGEIFDNNVAAVIPKTKSDLGAIWAFVSSPEYSSAVREINSRPGVTNGDLVRVAFDADRWRREAEQQWPDGIPAPRSDDPTQWLFEGRPEMAREPLQVAVGRLLGFSWPEQSNSDDLDKFGDDDGIVCLPAVAGETPAAERLEELLDAAYGSNWSPAKRKALLEQSGSRKQNLADWLRDDVFKLHCKVFSNRPFIWHIWDGRRDGFSALVNYHRLDRRTLERLIYTYLGQDWVERQRADAREDVPGADVRLAAALELRDKLEQILVGESPFDIFVRWKELAEQPIGWDPDLNDGVRLNIRPFVEAGVLRSKVTVHWRTDRGKNPDGSERQNDLHYKIAEKTATRGNAE